MAWHAVQVVAALACVACGGAGSRTVTVAEIPDPPTAAGVEAAERAGTYALTIDVDLEHGCSQSSESASASGTFVLEIGKDGSATLAIDTSGGNTIGPSFGEYMKGEQDFYHTSEMLHEVWKGSFTPEPSGLAISFDSVERSVAEWSGYGQPELPAATKQAASLAITCAAGEVQAYEPVRDGKYVWDTEGQTPVPVPAMLCSMPADFLGWFGDMVLVDGALALAAGSGLLVYADSFYYSERQVVRIAGEANEP